MVGPERADDTTTTAFEILAHHRRRDALQCLREFENPLALADLADEVAVRECEAPLPEIAPETVKRVYLSLYHVHIPKLVDGEYAEYDQERNTVALRENAAQLEPLEYASRRPVEIDT